MTICMTMELKKILPGSSDAALMDEVNLESFPPEELMSTSLQTELCEKGLLDVWAVHDGDGFVGFTTVYPDDELAYVFFLAVASSQRSHGYGARILELLRAHYAGKQLVLDIEPVDPAASDSDLRLRRKKFYLRNGYSESGYMLSYCGLSFEILYDGDGGFNLDGYSRMMDGIASMIRSCGFDVFKPEIFRIL